MISFVDRYLKFIHKSPTPYHAISQIKNHLIKRGFTEIKKEYSKEPGKYFIINDYTMIVAFTIPQNSNKLRIIATHCDSPALKLKPKFRYSSGNLNMARVRPYGGGLWHTWFDRPLGVAGLIVDTDLKHRLVQTDVPAVIIPSLAIHLSDRSDSFKYNKEIHLNGILTTNNLFDESKILSHDLSLVEMEAPVKSGDLMFAGRQDNLSSTFCAIEALEEGEDINVVAVFDSEEIGSETMTGAQSAAFKRILERITGSSLDKIKSFIISADAAHGKHPNYPEKSEAFHDVELGGGVVIKISNKYATTAVSSAIIKKLMLDNKLKYQEFVLKNDMAGGSTIGPMLSSGLGIRCIDLGIPLLGMHSVKEISSVTDLEELFELFNLFYKSKLEF
ncbi:putative aspartyl aminopeptidase [Astathelohania contejeani]|uniref:aspartyl aminopeptidase n=1 Tax=Astathelohania contejeani TaxID=164912 RepID=A0ABQ7I2Y2_9MICR|nr:putative aspartyl aminopeptidase [Thelohania contejeani]